MAEGVLGPEGPSFQNSSPGVTGFGVGNATPAHPSTFCLSALASLVGGSTSTEINEIL